MKYILLLTLLSCAQVTSLNLKKHQFGLLPTKIIWFQVAGLEEEQLSMLRFLQSDPQKTSFEENICLGKSWNYNLYQLRNPAESTFLSQMTGKKNIKNSCEDSDLRPIWSYIESNGYRTAFLENGASPTQSITNYFSCPNKGGDFLQSLYFYLRSEPPKEAATFHYFQDLPMNPNQVFYDRTCGGSQCGASLLEDFKAIHDRFQRVSQKQLFIIRDFSYLRAIDKKDWVKAREILGDLERTYAEAMKLTSSSDYLVLLTTGDSRFVEMPEQGKAWFDFEKESKNISAKRTKLSNLVLASGSRAENFCGIYDDSQIFERILSGPKQQGLELKIINPFK